MKSKVYCALVEVTPLPGCALDTDEVAGAAVRCYVRAGSSADARARCKSAFHDDLFDVVDVEWCVAHDEVEWETPDDEDGLAHVREAQESDDVVYGEFHTWGHDAPDA